MILGKTRWFGSQLLAATLLTATTPVWSGVIISEIVTVNRGGLRDADGDTPDWIELFNDGTEPVNLGAFTLTDDSRKPAQWKLPTVPLPPGAFLLVFASGKDRRDEAGSEWHASFKLSAAGEFVGLADSSGKPVSSLGPDIPPMEGNQAFGIPFRNGRPVPGARPGLLAAATPGAPNPDRTETAALRPPVFSTPRGFHSEPFRLALKAERGARIVFTLDGSAPDEKNSPAYSGAIAVTTTTVVRALACGIEGRLPSASVTHTYLFPEDVARQPDRAPAGWPRRLSARQGANGYGMQPAEVVGHTHTGLVAALGALPSLSLVTDAANLWSSDSGIWRWSQSRGADWERPLSVELLDPNEDEEGFQINCGMRVRGGYSRNQSNPKHAMRLYFRRQYGAGKLRYPLFGAEGAQAFDNIDLRTAQNYSWSFEQSPQNSMVREVFARDTQRDMGRTHTRSRYYHLYLNGMYWGIYQTQEHAEAAYGASYFGGEQQDFDAVKSSGHAIEATDGDLMGWGQMWKLAGQLARNPDAGEREVLYQQLQGCHPDGTRNPALPVYVDVQNLIDYMLIVFYTGMWDGPITSYANNSTCRNWFGIWKRDGGFGFQYFCHDFEHSLGVAGSLEIDRTGPFQAGWDIGSSNPQWIHQQLMAAESYLAAFQQRSAEVLAPGGLLSPEVNRARLNRRVAQIDQAIIAESARWSGGRVLTRDHWRNEIGRIHDYLEQRGELVKAQLRAARSFADGDPGSPLVAAPLYPGGSSASLGAPDIAVRPEGVSFLHENPAVEILYTSDGSDPRGDDGAPGAAAMTAAAERVDYRTLVADAPFRALVPTDGRLGDRWMEPGFDDSRWMQGRGAAGYETKPRNSGGTLYHEYLGLDLAETAAGRNTSVFLRFSFSVPTGTGGSHERMLLRMRFDDGFVAYLNGREISRANAPGELAWNAASGGKHDDAAAVQFVEFDVSAHTGLLQPGSNVLAIHALNDYLESSDMLTEPQLLAGRKQAGSVVPAREASPATILARARIGTEWSPLARPVATATRWRQADTDTVTISEIHYHPGDPSATERAAGHAQAEDFEFIEFTNSSDEPVDLAVTQLQGGVTFVFLPGAGALLPARSRCVLVSDRPAFRCRHGEQPVIAGEFHGHLGNGGDRIQWISANGTVLQDIRFDDKSPWPEAADGAGASLELRTISAHPQVTKPGSWKASATSGGTPGR